MYKILSANTNATEKKILLADQNGITNTASPIVVHLKRCYF
jgi:hypothetical protein